MPDQGCKAMNDWQEFCSLIWGKWEAAMTGSLIVALMLAIGGMIWQGPAYLLLFLATLAACLLLASYRVWRDSFHEAHPYSAEFYESAKERFNKLPDGLKEFFEKLSKDHDAASTTVSQAAEETRFLLRDPISAHVRFHPDYRLLIPRLVKEWRSAKANNP